MKNRNSMKANIMELVKSEEGTYRLNKFCYLYRWTKSGLNEVVDELILKFDAMNGVSFGSFIYIRSRDYEGIIAECNKAITDHFTNAANKLTSNLRAGYR